ncbi:MAG: hypothetical protein ACI9FJ_000717 [Alteromonadaceae bacterium]|jgi:hypothetical protein
MCKNSVQFQKGYSLPALFDEYGTAEQCASLPNIGRQNTAKPISAASVTIKSR